MTTPSSTSPPPTVPTAVRARVSTFLDTHGRTIAESPIPPALTSLLLLTHYPLKPPLLFAPFFAFSAVMNYDGYTVDGAGTAAVWSSLWLGSQGVRGVARGGVRGGVLGVLAAGQMVTGGWYWVHTGRYKGE